MSSKRSFARPGVIGRVIRHNFRRPSKAPPAALPSPSAFACLAARDRKGGTRSSWHPLVSLTITQPGVVCLAVKSKDGEGWEFNPDSLEEEKESFVANTQDTSLNGGDAQRCARKKIAIRKYSPSVRHCVVNARGANGPSFQRICKS